jgi:1-deoxy-D-xylulose-5-phosphate synthase
MKSGTGLSEFPFPDRIFDVGIAEQHAVTFSAGLACAGYKPFCTIYSTFLQRAYDQIAHDVAIQKLPVRFIIDRAGLVGADGSTHAGSFDIAYLSMLPNFIIMAPSDEVELMNMIATAVDIDHCPSAVRYPRGSVIGLHLPKKGEVLKIGVGRIVKTYGNDVAILSLGTRLAEALKAAEILTKKNIKCTVFDARFAKPIDEILIMQLANTHKALIVIEEGSIGGFGSRVLKLISDKNINTPIKTIHLPDRFIDHGITHDMYRDAGLNANSIVKEAEKLFITAAHQYKSALL